MSRIASGYTQGCDTPSRATRNEPICASAQLPVYEKLDILDKQLSESMELLDRLDTRLRYISPPPAPETCRAGDSGPRASLSPLAERLSCLNEGLSVVNARINYLTGQLEI